MKKFFYSFMALLGLFITAAKAQTSPCYGKAAFQFTINGNAVNFYSGSSSGTGFINWWNFGDGHSSDAVNPVHTFPQPGTFRVVHYIKDTARNCYDSAVKEIRIGTVSGCDLLQPKFEWRKDSLNKLKIVFINQSQPNAPSTSVSFKWSFGDGTSSADGNPAHIYTAPGQYNVCLTIRYTNNVNTCEKTYCSVVTIPQPCEFQPYFSWVADASNPLTIKFTNQTAVTNTAAKIKWNFGDGTYSTEPNPSHTYAKAGVYNVCIRIELSADCVKEYCKQVVFNTCTVQPYFTWATDSLLPLHIVKFQNQTPATVANPTNVKWTFGDGTGSNDWNTSHQYQQPGTYHVCLRIEFFAGCVKEICKDVVIAAPVNCMQLSGYKIEPVAGDPGAFQFNAEVINTTAKYTWTFGDGTGATGPTAKHKYERTGRYNVCLTVFRTENCASTTCKEVTAGPLNCELTAVKFEYQRLNTAGNSIKFKAVGNQPVLAQYWTIYKNNSTIPVVINATDPSYTFLDTGLYKICLRAITVNGCVKEYCQTIRIEQVVYECSLQIMPNPVASTIYFKVQVEAAQAIVASVVDITGVRKAVFYLNATPGSNSFAVPTGTLPAGYYTLEVKIGNRICTAKFQKVN